MNEFQNITQKKTAKLSMLRKAVQLASRNASKARSVLDSASIKVNLYETMLKEAQQRLAVSTEGLSLASNSKQNVTSLADNDNEAKSVMEETKEMSKNMISNVNGVVSLTLKAASTITSLTKLITERKAANPVISSELVTRVRKTMDVADQSAVKVISALSTVTSALSTSMQAYNTAELVHEEILELSKGLSYELWNDINESNVNEAEIPPTLIRIMKRKFAQDRNREQQLRSAALQANDQKIAAQNQLNTAEEKLVKAKAALAAAEKVEGASSIANTAVAA